MVVPRLIRQALGGEALTVYGDGNQQRCFCNLRDVVRALLGLAEHPDAVGQVFNIGSNHEISIKGLAEKIIKLTKSKSSISYTPYNEAYAPGFEDMMRRVPDTQKVHDLLGWEAAIPLDETLASIRDEIASSLKRPVSPS